MSQHPSHYPPPHQPSYYGQPPGSPAELLAPARRAGVLMIALGVLFVLGGLCTAFAIWMMNRPELFPTPQAQEMQQQIELIEKQFGTSAATVYTVMGAVLIGIGATLGTLGFGVRGGRMAAVVTSLVLASLLALVLGINILVGAVQSLATGAAGAQVLLGACILVVPLGMLLLLLVWLIQAVRASSKLELARQQFQAQMWQYQHQQQMYQQPGGAGSGPVTPPPPGGYHQYPGPQLPAAPPSTSPPEERKDPPQGPPPGP